MITDGPRTPTFLPGLVFGIIATVSMMLVPGGSHIAAQTTGVRAEIVWMDDPDEVSISDAEKTPIPADFGVMLDTGIAILNHFDGGR
jgi:hypothetical protein